MLYSGLTILYNDAITVYPNTSNKHSTTSVQNLCGAPMMIRAKLRNFGQFV